MAGFISITNVFEDAFMFACGCNFSSESGKRGSRASHAIDFIGPKNDICKRRATFQLNLETY